ncbi:T9SS type A sorting domain-containing protein, partial [Bacteroidales bacterium AH-315-I05]|nr:T9SS type A sorting domain-containing protein [Bacteroidales bacterium AH-315-I05]
REGAVGLSIGNKGYIGTGWDGVGYQDFWEYMPGVTANAGSDTAICSGSTIIGGSSTASGIFQSYIYSWSPSGSLNDSTIANPTATPTNTTTYIVTVTDSLGCTTTDTVTVTLPSPLSTNIIKTDVSCNGYNDGAANLTVTGGFTPYAYSWSTGATTQNISGVSANTYTVTITEYCGSTASDGVTITQSSILVASAGNDTSICKGENAALGGSPTALGGTASYTYLWSPSIGLSSTTSSNPSASPNSLTTYTVQVTDANGCTATDNVTVDNFVLPSQPICLITVDSSSTRNVMVWEKPATAGIDSFKIYRDIIGVYTHIESVPYDSLSTFTDTTQGVNPNTTAYRYKLSGVDTCGNESALSDFHKTIHLQISPGTGNNVNLNWDDYLGFSFTFYRILRDDFGTGNWQKIDSVSAGVTSYTDALPSDSARYIVEVVPPNVCTATKTTEYYNSSRSNAATKTGSTQNIQSSIYNQNSAIEIIPNPTKGKFEIRYKGIWEIGVYNVLGERVYWSVVSGKSQVIDISNQPKGIYFLQLKTGEGIMNKKVILQ